MTTTTIASRSPLEGLSHLAALETTPDVACLQTVLVNVALIGAPGSRDWVLVDAGIRGSAGRIMSAARERYGDTPPRAILLTHGHFDHVGALHALAEHWNVPVYAHPQEMPYLTGQADYPPPDPTVRGGMARLACLYPRSGIDLRDRVRELPSDGSVPGLPGWHWLHTPGHTPGHVSFGRKDDRTLIAGDAFVTVRQESALAVLTQKPNVHGPPAYFTPDWAAARASVEQLAAWRPTCAATGHGVPMQGSQLQFELDALVRAFDRAAVPAHGYYVRHPVRVDERGFVDVPATAASRPCVRAGLAVAGLAGISLALAWSRASRTP